MFSNLNYNFSKELDLRNLQEQVEKALCFRKLFWPFTIQINCCSELTNFANSWPSALNFKTFSQSLEQIFLIVGQNNFGNKIPFLCALLSASLLEFLILNSEFLLFIKTIWLVNIFVKVRNWEFVKPCGKQFIVNKNLMWMIVNLNNGSRPLTYLI